MHINFQHFSNKKLSNDNFKTRIVYSIILIFFLIGFLLFRLFYLQVIESKKFTMLSDRNQLTLIPLEPKRGLIYDRNGKILATNEVSYNLEIIPQIAKNIQNTFAKLKELKFLDDNDIKNYNKIKTYRRPFEPITLKDNISEKESALIATQLHELTGINITARLVRKYPYGIYSSHLVGYTGSINQKEFAVLDKSNYLTSQQIGKVGIEKNHEALLHGQLGYEQVEIDARGHVVNSKNVVNSVAGNDLYLTIDIDLQRKVHDIIQGYKGAAIVVHTKTGEVLSMVSSPSYDPNILLSNNNRQKELQALFKNPKKPLYNRSINGLYPLASPVKPFLALQGLEKKKINRKYQLFDPGWYKLPNSKHLFRDVSYNSGGNGWVNLHKSIVKSSDTYYYHLANLLGIEDIYEILTKFGFGKQTEIDLWNESSGLVPNKSWKLENKSEPWYTGDTLLVGIGQGFLQVTPVQIAQATMLLANKGHGYQLHLLNKYITQAGNVIDNEKISLKPIKLSNNNYWQWIHYAMQGVINEKGGTGWRFGKDANYIAAGKTGTGQIISLHHNENIDKDNIPDHLKDHSSFIAFAPVNDPEIAVIVLIENSQGSSLLTRQICDAYFNS